MGLPPASCAVHHRLWRTTAAPAATAVSDDGNDGGDAGDAGVLAAAPVSARGSVAQRGSVTTRRAARFSLSTVPGEVRKTGWLMKQGHLIKNWKRRWFVLEDGYLAYYTDETCGARWCSRA